MRIATQAYHVRPAAVADLSAVRALARRCFAEPEFGTDELDWFVDDSHRGPGGALVVARDATSAELAGFAASGRPGNLINTIDPGELDADWHAVYDWLLAKVRKLKLVAVEPTHRRRGLGERLVRAALATNFALGVERVYAQCDAGAPMASFYDRCGFRLWPPGSSLGVPFDDGPWQVAHGSGERWVDFWDPRA
jgi:GNAT superfamily N-acetyltransferase